MEAEETDARRFAFREGMAPRSSARVAMPNLRIWLIRRSPQLKEKLMIRALSRWAFIVFVLLPAAAIAEPIKLKLAFFSSDQTNIYVALIKPFVEAVNAGAAGAVEIEPNVTGVLGRPLAQQSQILRDGVADIAFINPNVTVGNQFPDDAVMQMSGLFKDTREATIAYTRLANSGALNGYDDFVVIGAVAMLPVVINSNLPIASLGDLKGKKIRVNSAIEEEFLQSFGMVPALIPINEVSLAISSHTLDAATAPLGPLFEFGLSRVTTYHYFAPLGAVPLTLLMNRKKFDSLPTTAQGLIRKYSGEWLAERFAAAYDADSLASMNRLTSVSARHLIFPSSSELGAFDAAAERQIEKWAARGPHNRELLTQVKAEISRLRNRER